MTNEHFKGIQLWSVRDQLKENPANCIKRLAEIGFNQAEGFDLVYLEQLKPTLDDHGIEAKSSFILWSHVTKRYDLAEQIGYEWMPKQRHIDGVIEHAVQLGLDTIVCGYLLPEERTCLDDYKRVADRLNLVGQKCVEAGIQLLYHNHNFEFQPIENDVVPYFYLMEHTDPQWVNFEVDTLWAEVTGQSFETFFAKLGSRLQQLHLKTGVKVDAPLYEEKQYLPSMHDYSLDKGFIDMKKLIALAQQMGVERLYIEQEYSDDLYSSLDQSLKFLVENSTHPTQS